ncbi:unnamed protein product [Calypogeia fissa]
MFEVLEDQYRTIVLYSVKDESWVELPPVPDLENGILRGCQCVSLDGKVYVLVGHFSVLDNPGSDAVFGCGVLSGVLNGKIFVFGVMSLGDPVDGSEVYDPKENMWSPISGMPTLRAGHIVEVVGEELVLHNGLHWDRDCLDIDPELSGHLDVYHPGKNAWRQVIPSGCIVHEFFLAAKDELYSMGKVGIHILEYVKFVDPFLFISR